MCLPHEVPPALSLVSPESKASYKAPDDWGCESGGIRQGDLRQGRKKGQYKSASPCWPLLQATGTPSHWGLLESLMKCLSIPHLGNENGKQLSIILQPLWIKSSPTGSKSLVFPSCTCLSADFPRESDVTATERPQAPEANEKGMGQIKCYHFPRVQKRATGPVWVGCLPMKCSRTLHRSSRLVGNWWGRTEIFLTSPSGSVTVYLRVTVPG